jgi:XamI restriction endonuclease
MPKPPQRWTDDELEADAKASTEIFVTRRKAERARREQAIAEHAPEYRQDFLDLLAATNNLREISGASLQDRQLLRAARFVAIPFISDDDLDSLTGANLKGWMQQTTGRGRRPSDEDFDAAAEVIAQQLDPYRTPWIAKDRAPTKAEVERYVAASITLRLNSRLGSLRRSEAAARQEQAVRDALAAAGYSEFKGKGKTLTDPQKEMPEGTYSPRARLLAGASVDVPIRLKGGHPTGLTFIALEAKDTNSAVNSRKRLIEVMDKATAWNAAGLPYEFRTGAVVSGVLPLHRLVEAQDRGVWLFWEHRLEDLTTLLAGP